jgi:hypothetical protein
MMSKTSLATHWLRAAIIAWAIFFVVLTIKGAVQPNHRSVYFAFTAGARDFWAGDEFYGRDGFYYGPVFALMMTPFAQLPDPLGAVLWNWFNAAVFLFAVVRFYRDVIAPRFPNILLGTLLVLTLIGSARSIYAAQSNALIIGMILLASVEIVHRRWWRAAFCLALPVHMKIWPLAAAMLLCVRHPKQLIARIAIAIAVLGATPLATHSPSYVARYYGKWKDSLAERQAKAVRWPGYRDAWTLWETMVGAVDKRVYTIVQLSAAAVIFAWCLLLRVRGLDERAALMDTLALWAGWQMLFGPGSERLTLAILAAPAAWLVVQCYAQRRSRVAVTITWLLIFIIGTGAVERKLLPWMSWAHAALPLGVALFMMGIIASRMGLLAGLTVSLPFRSLQKRIPTPTPAVASAVVPAE